MENHLEIDNIPENMTSVEETINFQGSQIAKRQKSDHQKNKQVKFSSISDVKSDTEIDNEIDIKTIFSSHIHPLSILDDIRYKLRVSPPQYQFSQPENPGEITCILNFLN